MRFLTGKTAYLNAVYLQTMRIFKMIKSKRLRLGNSEGCKTKRSLSELCKPRERGKTPPAVCPCCVLAFGLLSVAHKR